MWAGFRSAVAGARNRAASAVSGLTRMTSVFEIDPLTASAMAVGGGAAVALSQPGDRVAALGENFLSMFGPASLTVGAMTGSVPMMLAVGMLVDTEVGRAAGRGIRAFRRVGEARRFHHDVSPDLLQTAWTMRQQMARDMASSVFNARQWLGREASFLHG